jgi:metal-responsive CopG/Arc/MetJ family transcriptional regulator
MNKNKMLTIRINENKIRKLDEIRRRIGENRPRGDLIRRLIDDYIKSHQKCSKNGQIIPKRSLSFF